MDPEVQEALLNLKADRCDVEELFEFIRTLVIVKDKNPTRGAKRAIQGPQKITNHLDHIIEWINPEDDVEQFASGYTKTKLPILIVKAPQYEEGATYIRLNKRVFSAGCDIRRAFLLLVQTYFIFKFKFEPSLANFYNFFVGAVLTVDNMTTTVNNFIFQLN
ncbi:uncharacterized protein LOC135701464 [Ochlerotatus camptorhynchus]|uniref:uncharacterized protein LOC135701464 n=1 Tax=Ochlerotatus camptorhynchus TaxID=644619 RepID=UPI0031D28089